MKFLLLIFLAIFSLGAQQFKVKGKWRGIHYAGIHSDGTLASIENQVPDLAKMGVNTFILEINYGLGFVNHPELRQTRFRYITKKAARKFVQTCRTHGIQVIPLFESLGHQSWSKNTANFLRDYPYLDAAPGKFPGNKGIYCREWDPLNPKVNLIIFSLIDDIIDFFQADAIHIGLDEVFLLGNKETSTKGHKPSKVFARVINEFHDYIVKKRKRTMLVWGDRLIPGHLGYYSYESSKNETYPALDLIPKDIIITDWHYGVRNSYPSIPLFVKKGFRVVPATWKDERAANAFINFSRSYGSKLMLGHLITQWGSYKAGETKEIPYIVNTLKLLKKF